MEKEFRGKNVVVEKNPVREEQLKFAKMRLLEFKENLHDVFYTFETSLIGKAHVFFNSKGNAFLLIPVSNLESEFVELTGKEGTVYIDKCYFLFSDVSMFSFEGAVHDPVGGSFINRFSQKNVFALNGEQSGLFEQELASFGLMDFGYSYDGRFNISSRKSFLVLLNSSVIMHEHPGLLRLDNVSSETESFLLSIPVEVTREILI